jgi:hypothetical protein
MPIAAPCAIARFSGRTGPNVSIEVPARLMLVKAAHGRSGEVGAALTGCGCTITLTDAGQPDENVHQTIFGRAPDDLRRRPNRDHRPCRASAPTGELRATP